MQQIPLPKGASLPSPPDSAGIPSSPPIRGAAPPSPPIRTTALSSPPLKASGTLSLDSSEENGFGQSSKATPAVYARPLVSLSFELPASSRLNSLRLPSRLPPLRQLLLDRQLLSRSCQLPLQLVLPDLMLKPDRPKPWPSLLLSLSSSASHPRTLPHKLPLSSRRNIIPNLPIRLGKSGWR